MHVAGDDAHDHGGEGFGNRTRTTGAVVAINGSVARNAQTPKAETNRL